MAKKKEVKKEVKQEVSKSVERRMKFGQVLKDEFCEQKLGKPFGGK